MRKIVRFDSYEDSSKKYINDLKYSFNGFM